MGERLGFIGLGIMGSDMVGNLIKAGHSPTVWNRTPNESPDGANEVPDLETLAGNRISSSSACRTPPTWSRLSKDFGPTSNRASSSSTTRPSPRSKPGTLAASLSDQSWLDAPVSGGSEGAARGTLSTMVGGNEADLERARPNLSAYSTNITHLGPVGNGQLAKLVNQILVVGNQLAASEALLFAEAAGLDLPTTLDAIKDGAAGSWMLANRGPQMIANDWRPGFTINLQQKDLRLVLDTADELGTPLPATSLIFQLYRGLQTAGHGHEGNHALIKALKQLAGSG